MEFAYILALFLFVLILLLGSGVWVGLALMGVGGVIMTMFTDNPAGDVMITAVWSSSTSWTLTALPLFILMGEILFRTRLSEDLFRALAPIMSKLPGGLMHTNIVGSTLFAAVSGSSAATLTTVGKMSIPELRRRNYPEKKIIGTLAGASTLGLMIPPSLTLIVYGVTVNESITKLFMAGIIPGIVLAAMFMTYVAVTVKAPTSDQEEASIGGDGPQEARRLQNIQLLLPLLILIGAVIGSMYSGLATATEAAAIGVVGALVLSSIQRELSFVAFRDSLLGAVRTSALIALILMGASYLSVVMGFTGLPRALAEYIGTFGLSPVMLLVALAFLYVVIGMFLDGISSIVLTMAVVEPLVRAAGIDIIWFGIFIVVVVEMAQITPPVGFNLFVMQGMTGHQIDYISRAAFPMFLIMVLMIVLLIMFPGIATWLSTAVQ